MKRVIKAFEKFPEALQEEIYGAYMEGQLNKATFPFQGNIAEGVIFSNEEEECTYLIPISTIKASRLSHNDDDDDDDDMDFTTEGGDGEIPDEEE